jgi:hypothetical protein
MKIFYTFFFLLVFSCNTVKKEYDCGDHPCIDKKEFNEYFSKNLTIEIKSQKKIKNKTLDLVSLNTRPETEEKINNKNSKKEEKIKKKNEKKQLKVEKIRLLEERKIQEIEKRKKEKDLNIMKIKSKNEKITNNKIINNRQQVKKILGKKKILTKATKVTREGTSVDSLKSKKMKNICDEIKDCNIDKIAEVLLKNGENKPFPNISSN